MLTIQRIINLLSKARKGRLAAAEERELDQWRHADPRHEQLYLRLTQPVEDPVALRQMQAIDVESALTQLKQKRDGVRGQRRLRSRWMRTTAAVAALVLLGGLSFLFYFTMIHPGADGSNAVSARDEAIVPGTNRATLTLADGSQVVLDDVAEGSIAEQAGIRVVKTADGKVRYEILSDHPLQDERFLEMHTITTPVGGQYQIRLPDGSEVWLNASSSLTYPTQFTATERRVSLEGEGYFEVAKSTGRDGMLKPFIVELPEQTIEVLGTTLNVKSYPEDLISKTTLITGSVRVSTGTHSIILRPGQQAHVNRDNEHLGVQEVDTDEIISWKNGYFAFQNERINSIMNEIARWYDVEVVYKTPVRQTTFEGSISKYSELAEVLEILELTGGCKFTIEGRRVTVMQ